MVSNFLKTRIRVKALDPYGLMTERSHFSTISEIEKGYRLTYFRCHDDNCHATLVSKKVKPDSQGNSFGLYGCLTHQHPLPRDRRSQIIFENRKEAYEFYNENLMQQYVKSEDVKGEDRMYYRCRRTRLKIEYGYQPCKSSFSIHPTFSRKNNLSVDEIRLLPEDEVPYSIVGYFYHDHENDKRYHRDKQGLWKSVSNKPSKRSLKKKLQDQRPIIKNGKVYPMSARLAGITKEDVLNARIRGFGKSISTQRRRKKSVQLKKGNCD